MNVLLHVVDQVFQVPDDRQVPGQAGKNTKLVCVAIARELVGFIWDIVCREMPRLRTVAA